MSETQSTGGERAVRSAQSATEKQAATERTVPAGRNHDDAELVKRLGEARKRILQEVGTTIVGQRTPLDLLLVAILCRGHALLIGVPGLGKTLMARTLARVLDLEFRRIQFTPDLMPSDITGTDIIEENPETGKRVLTFMQGPIFANFVLSDEINRAPPKTQAALLQAMQEIEVTVGRTTYPLSPPFFVVATQNPIEFEGTYPLPEVQLDRFMLSIPITYPSPADEMKIVKSTTTNVVPDPKPVLHGTEVVRLQELVRGTPVADDVVAYAVRLATATRPDGDGTGAFPMVDDYVSYGSSPRASQNLILGAKAVAVLSGRYHVDFADVRKVARSVLRHRLVMNFRSRADKITADQVIESVLEAVPEDSV